MEQQLIAPCGMNCGVCISYLAKKHDLNKQGFNKRYCPGCLPRGKHCTFMANHCDLLGKGLVRFCYQCSDFPCRRLKALDKRYRTRYRMSMLDNLKFIETNGIARFLDEEKVKWSCPSCGKQRCCHNGLCLDCELDKLRRNKQYCWDEG